MNIETRPSGILAKVTAISKDGCRVYLDLRDGKTSFLTM